MNLVTRAFSHADGEPQAPVQDYWQIVPKGTPS